MSYVYGIVLMFLAACSYGAAAIVIKLAYRAGLQPSALLTLQNMAAIACLWPLMLAVEGMPRLRRGQAARLFWQGLLGNFGLSVCYFWAARRIDVSLLSIVLFAYPGLVLSYEIMVEKRKAAAREFLVLAFALAGVLLAVDPSRGSAAGSDRLGLLLAAGAAVSYAFMILCGRKLARELSPLVTATLTSTVSTLALAAVLPPGDWFSADVLGKGWIYISSCALLSTVLPLNLMYLGIRRIGAFHASVISIAELVFILGAAYYLLNERLTPWQGLGAGMILLSVVLIRPAAKKLAQGAT